MHGRSYRPSRSFWHISRDAHVIRNAGAVAKDLLRSLAISEQLLGTQKILLVKHTGLWVCLPPRMKMCVQCGEESRRRSEKELEGLDFLPFPDLDLTVKDDVEYLKKSKAITSNAVISG